MAEAPASFTANFNRLDRDFAGMARYHELARSGAVSLPVLACPVRIAAGGERAFVGERTISLVVSLKFRAVPPAAFRSAASPAARSSVPPWAQKTIALSTDATP
nr:type IV secretory system conjugative DNA transfer family protein [Methylobacterium tarhaniae]